MELKVMSIGEWSLCAYFGKSSPIFKEFMYPIDVDSWWNQVKIVEKQNTGVKCFKDFIINLKPLEKASQSQSAKAP